MMAGLWMFRGEPEMAVFVDEALNSWGAFIIESKEKRQIMT